MIAQRLLALVTVTPGGVSCGDCINGSVQDLVARAVSVLAYVIGAASVLMILIGGLMYVISAGDPSRTKAAKDTILYAVIGVVVSLLAYSIVRFVLGAVH